MLLVLCNTFTPIRDLLVTNRALVLAGTALHVSADEVVGVTPLGGGGGGGGFQMADPGSGNSANEDLALITETAPFNAYEYGWNNNNFAYGVPIANPQIPAGAFLIIGHCVWSWLLALAAGCFAGLVTRSLSSEAAK